MLKEYKQACSFVLSHISFLFFPFSRKMGGQQREIKEVVGRR
jgi:hypothetical protein